MTFKMKGFLSSDMDHFRAVLRTVPEYQLWFAFAEDLVRLGLDMLNGHETPLDDPRRLAMSPLFVRTHQSFQAALLLAERGMIGDAHTVLRSAVEGAIALHALANDPHFVDQLVAAHFLSRRRLTRVALETYGASYSLQQIAQMEAGVAEVDAMKNDPNKKLQDIVWADVALKHCPDLYQLLYRVFSWDGTHTNINSINRHVVSDTGGEITGLKIGPDSTGLVETLQAACLTFLWAAEPFARIFDKSDMNAQVHDQLHRLNELPQVEPTDPITAIGADRPRRDGRSQPQD